VCHKGTVRGSVLAITVALAAGVGWAQSAPSWRKVGGFAVDLGLAAPATGAVDQVWFAPSGSLLYARTRSGRTFQTADYEHWLPVDPAPEAPPAMPAGVARFPEPGARVVTAPAWHGRVYALGKQLFRSEDGGRTWENLTAYKSTPIVGAGQHAIAVSPSDPEQIVVANDFGVWRSLDGGMSWNGLNQLLPNLTVSRILGGPSGVNGTRVTVAGWGAVELPPGQAIWQPATDATPDPEAALRQRFAGAPGIVGATLTAIGQAGKYVYAGTADGRVLQSIDSGASFHQTPTPRDATGPVLRIQAEENGAALAVMSGNRARVLRTITGNFWDVLDGNLPDGAVHGIAAERTAGAVYVATDKGVFFGRADLNNPSSPSVNWTNLTATLPGVPATAVRLDANGFQLYIALDGYGVWAATAPHRVRNVRIVNGGDFSSRAAAPGSILSVIGARVDGATGAGLNYPVLAGDETESQVQVPFEAVGPSVALALRTATGTVTRDIAVQAVSPAIIVNRDGGPMLWDADTGLPLDIRNVAHANGRMHIWATGLGRVRPDWPTGMRAPMDNPPAVAAQMRAFLDRKPLQVTQATLVPGYVGFYLIEVQLPAAVNAGTSELYISADGQESNRVQVSIEP
jgi:uncharacterized protein (TIGR03437 family)